jgi:S-adenosylmethionine-diacylgycerolhomoserine-N-methlytransferase
MSTTAVQRFYKFHAYVYDFTRWTILHGRKRAVDKLGLRPGSSVLEIGCGTGLNFAHMQAKLDQQAGKLVGLDFSADMLMRAERRVQSRGWQNVELIQADATKLDLDREFDGILFAYSLTMIPDWEASLERAKAHLAPGGKLVVLDFGEYQGWGPMAPVMRTWLRLNHVDTRQPYFNRLVEICGNGTLSHWLGGYNFTAVAERGD